MMSRGIKKNVTVNAELARDLFFTSLVSNDIKGIYYFEDQCPLSHPVITANMNIHFVAYNFHYQIYHCYR